MTRNVIVCCVLFATSILTAAADPVFQQSPTPEVNPWAEKGIPSDFQFGAYGTRKNVGQPWHRQSRTDDYADVSVRFENAYATPVCTPTRAMSLTGLHPNQTGFLERLDSPLDLEKNNRLPVHLKTVGHVFQSAGYETAIAGKRHLGDFHLRGGKRTVPHAGFSAVWMSSRRSNTPKRPAPSFLSGPPEITEKTLGTRPARERSETRKEKPTEQRL